MPASRLGNMGHASSLQKPIWMFCPRIGKGNEPTFPGGLPGKWQRLKAEYLRRRTTEYGSYVASAGFNSAALTFLRHKFTLVTPPSMQESVRKSLPAHDRSSEEVEIISRSEIPAILPERGCSAWIDACGEFIVPFYARSLYGATQSYPIIATHHSISYPHFSTQVFLPLLMLDTRPYDAFVCSSNDARKHFQKLLSHASDEIEHQFGARKHFAGTLEVIPFGVDTGIYKPRSKQQSRRRFGLKKNAFTILYVGRLSPVDKGDIIPFLGMVKDLAAAIQPRPLQVLLAGGSHHEYASLLQELITEYDISSQVLLLLRVPDAELAELYTAADVFLSLSDNIQECLGIAAIEALASGTPQIVPDWSGYRDTVVEGLTGYRIPTYWCDAGSDIDSLSTLSPSMWSWSHYKLAQSVAVDPRLLRDALIKLARNGSLVDEMGAASVDRARSHYDWNIIMSRYDSLIRERSQTAHHSERVPSTHRAPFIPSLSTTARHLATSVLDENTILMRSDRGCAIPHANPKYAAHFIDMESVNPVALCRDLPDMTAIGTLASYKRQILSRTSCEPLEATRSVMWLIKYGYLDVVPGLSRPE